MTATRPGRTEDNGFTLIELLVVIVIIGVLAAIAVPMLLSQRERAVDTALKSDLHVVVSELEGYYASTMTYPPAAGVDATSVFPGMRLSADHVVTMTVDVATQDYCLVATAGGKGTQDWVFRRSSGGIQPRGVTTC